MARIDYTDFQGASEELRGLVGPNPLNILRAVGHSDQPTIGFLRFGFTLLQQGDLDPTLRELVILRISALSGAEYEFRQHAPRAREAGVAEAKITAIRHDPGAAAFTPLERAVLKFTDQVVQAARADDAAFEAVAAQLTKAQLVELLYVIGFYMSVCRLILNLDVELETP